MLHPPKALANLLSMNLETTVRIKIRDELEKKILYPNYDLTKIINKGVSDVVIDCESLINILSTLRSWFGLSR